MAKDKLEPKDFLDRRGMLRTASLFKETMPDGSKKAGYKPVMTLREGSVDGLPSLHDMFIDSRDITGYTTCMDTLGVWRYWERLWRCKQLKAFMDVWKSEMEALLKAEGLEKMRRSDSPAAAKYLIEKGWEKRAGRPSKASIEKEAKQQAQVDNDLKDDIARLRAIK